MKTTLSNHIPLKTLYKCVCPDYLLVHEKHVETLVKELTQAVKDQFGSTDAQRQSSELGRLAQTNHASRLVDMLQDVESTPGCQILIGGSQHCRISDRYVCPTLVLNPPLDSRLMTEEIFGPILPIVTVKSRTEAQQIIQSMPGIPLAMYVFTTRKNVFTEMIETCPAGSAVRNDLLIHFGTPHLPMSGKGSSGYGSYRGIYSWRAFTHPQSQVYRPCMSPADFGLLRYHPFGPMKQKLILGLSNIPAIPPLYPMLWLIAISATYITLSVDTLRFALADGMAFIVDWLRK
jgi:aldehyde dehydrogenase (NAD+)